MSNIEWSMPLPPKGLAWVLKIDSMHNNMTLWLFRRSWLTGRPTMWSELCKSVHIPGRPTYCDMPVEGSTTEELAEAIINTADEVLGHFDEARRRKPTVDEQASALNARLGIKVEVKR